MKRLFTGALAALFFFLEAAAFDFPKPTATVRLYPAGQTADQGIVENGRAVTLGPAVDNGLRGETTDRGGHRFGNIGDQAWIEVFLPENGNGQMIVICPGGGYSYCSYEGEGALVADWCLQRGIAACVVLYRMPNGHSAAPLTDVQNAFRYCRAHAAEWGVNQIGVMGFSAGGHLAASASTLFTDETTRPDFSVLVYPVISLEEFTTHAGTRFNLLGERTTREQVEAWSLDTRVTPQTPPAILLLSADDRAVAPENSIRYFRSMQRCGVPGELHILSSGGHGWGFGTVATIGRDALGDQRAVFDSTLERWLAARRNK
ncbi:MAG: alpha/beta hydrolase [Bacteroidales bacterium]|nr:alpha/beta hydrolase [Bacteroidales bacterium]